LVAVPQITWSISADVTVIRNALDDQSAVRSSGVIMSGGSLLGASGGGELMAARLTIAYAA
jgi:hypothetical protein